MELDPSSCEQYLRWALGDGARLVEIVPLARSTRQRPWRLDVEVEGMREAYVLRAGARGMEREFHVLKAVERLPIPTPRVLGWDSTGDRLGVPAFLVEWVAGESLLGPLSAGEPWAEDVYIDVVCSLQAISIDDLPGIQSYIGTGETVLTVLKSAYQHFAGRSDTLADMVYAKLRERIPRSPSLRFSNGDLWPDNFIVRDGQLVGVIDFENAGFTDPIYEFLLAFFVSPDLRGRGTEERYCRRMGFDSDLLPWYRAVECFATLAYVERSGHNFVHHTPASLREALQSWLAEGS